MSRDTAPEVLRAPLTALVMDVKGILDGTSGIATTTSSANNNSINTVNGSLLDIREVLQEMITPPDAAAVNTAVTSLTLVGALKTVSTGGGNGPSTTTSTKTHVEKQQQRQQHDKTTTSTQRLTSLGRHLVQMPCDPRIGKMLIYGAMLRCLDPILTVAAAVGFGKLFCLSCSFHRSKFLMHHTL